MPDGLTPDIIALRERCLVLAVDRLGASTSGKIAQAVVVASVMVDFVERGDVDWDMIEVIEGDVIRQPRDSGAASSEEGPAASDEARETPASGELAGGSAPATSECQSGTLDASAAVEGQQEDIDATRAAVEARGPAGPDTPPPSAAAAPSPAARTGASPCAVPAAADTGSEIATPKTPEPSWKDWFAHQWHAGVDLGELTKQFKLSFAEIDKLIQELGIVGSPQRRQATRDALAALKAAPEIKDDPIALWTKTRKTDFAAAYRSGQAEDAIRKTFGLTWEHYYRALEILSLRGDRKRADALATEKAKRPPHNAGKPSVWTQEREDDFTRLWERGDDLEEIASFFKREHDLNLTSGGIAAHASVRDLSNNAKRKAARSHKTAAFQARAARRRLEKSVRQGRTPASALLDLATPNEQLESAGLPRIPSNSDEIRQNLPESAEVIGVDLGSGPDATVEVTMAAGKIVDAEVIVDDVASGPPRADTTVFAAPVNGRPAAERQALQARREPAGGARAPIARPATVLPAPDAKTWPLPKRAFVTAGWKQGQTYEQIAEAATAGGYPMKPKDVIQAVPQLGLTNDPDRRSAMHGGGA